MAFCAAKYVTCGDVRMISNRPHSLNIEIDNSLFLKLWLYKCLKGFAGNEFGNIWGP